MGPEMQGKGLRTEKSVVTLSKSGWLLRMIYGKGKNIIINGNAESIHGGLWCVPWMGFRGRRSL